jgi:hypothetical protein
MAAKLLISNSGTLDPVFTLGVDEKLIIVTGHCSRNFSQYLSDRFSNELVSITSSQFDWLKHESSR